MQGSLKVKDIRGVIPFLIVPTLCLCHWEEVPLPSHFPPLIHHPDRVLPSFPSLVPMPLPPRFQASLPRRAAGKWALPLVLLPWYNWCLRSSPVPCFCFFPCFTFTMRTSYQFRNPKLEPNYSEDRTSNESYYYFYAQTTIAYIKNWLRCFCCTYFCVARGPTWWRSTALPNNKHFFHLPVMEFKPTVTKASVDLIQKRTE